GSAKQGRDRRTQAILPLKGKILNVEKARFDKMLSSQEIGTMITALGTGIGKDDFDISKLRYHKVVIMTDADVDGSHILTLLLTFFYRQMPEVIERGHLYIAQPPLYRVSKGKKGRYVASDEELFEYLMELGLAEKRYYPGTKAKEIVGDRLQTAVRSIHRLQRLQARLSQRLDPVVLKYLIETGKVSIGIMRDREKLEARMELLSAAFTAASREDETLKWMINEDTEQGCYWVQFERRDHGRMMISRLERDLVGTAEFSEALKLCATIQALVTDGAYLTGGERRWEISHYDDIASIIEKEGKKGMNIQRYKGLGEMNPEQLWETTMDSDVRTLLQVTLEDVVMADETFSTLMGDAVEPRRKFIQDNALKVQNLDV
ncbi:MAG: DNA gyrase subunit B, partial [Zetaproteobacteria bacterium]|nr:DNA gyrase subunit B [Zetaproteobacteria bacterium]